jgi:hypothetical protein
MPGNNALGGNNSASIIYGLTARPPQTPRSRPASARTVRNIRIFRQKALNAIKSVHNKLNSMTNKEFESEVVRHMKTIKNFKNFGTLSIKNIPYLIAAKSSGLLRRQNWKNVR